MAEDAQVVRLYCQTISECISGSTWKPHMDAYHVSLWKYTETAYSHYH